VPLLIIFPMVCKDCFLVAYEGCLPKVEREYYVMESELFAEETDLGMRRKDVEIKEGYSDRQSNTQRTKSGEAFRQDFHRLDR
jgi:hypothetical protein